MGFLTFLLAPLLCQSVSSSAVCESSGGLCMAQQDAASFIQVQRTLALGAEHSQEVVDVFAKKSKSSGPIPKRGEKKKQLASLKLECSKHKNEFKYFDVKGPAWRSGCMASEKYFLTVKSDVSGLNPENIEEFNVQGNTADPSTWTNLEVYPCPELPDKAKKALGGYAACAFVFAFPVKDNGDNEDDWTVSPILDRMGWCPQSDDDARNLFKFGVPAGSPYLSSGGVVNNGAEIAFPFDVTDSVKGCKKVGVKCKILGDCKAEIRNRKNAVYGIRKSEKSEVGATWYSLLRYGFESFPR